VFQINEEGYSIIWRSTGERSLPPYSRGKGYWDAHNNAACRHERDRALQLYNIDGTESKSQVLRFGSATAVKNISVLTGLRLKTNQAQRK